MATLDRTAMAGVMAATLTPLWPSGPVLRGGTRPADDVTPSRPALTNAGGSPGTTNTTSVAPLGDYALARAMRRQAARQNLAGREQQMQDERRALVLKQHREGLSAEENRRLRIVRWQLDLLEDALMGEQLDRLERLAVAQERSAREIADVAARLEAHGLAARPRRRG